jgi:hypothetical protein
MIPRMLLLLLVHALVWAQGDQNHGVSPVTVTVCEALSKPLKYDGQVVQMRGRVNGTDEGTWFIGDNCAGIFVTDNNHIWPSMVFLATPSSTTVGRTRLHSVDFNFDLQSSRRLEEKYRQIRARVPDECISWTYTGLFETRRDWSTAKATYPNGTSKVIGFGHLGEAPAQIILKSADDVSIVSNCAAGSAAKKH